MDKFDKHIEDIIKKLDSIEDIVCRYGGDEFVVIFKKHSLKFVQEKMVVISKIINDYFKYSQINISFSVGISFYEYGKSLDNTIKEADNALYETKEKGKRGITIYNKNSYSKVYK